MINYKKFTTHTYLIYLYAIIGFLFKAIVILIPTITQHIVDAALSKNNTELIFFGYLSIIVSIIFIIFMYLISRIKIILYSDIDFSLKTSIAKNLLYGNYSNIKEKDIGYYLQRHNNDINNVRFLYFEKEIDFVINILYFLALFYSIMNISIYVSFLLILTIPIFILFNLKFIPIIEKNANVYFKDEEKLNSNFEILYANGHASRCLKLTNILFSKYFEQNSITKNMMKHYYFSDEKYNAFVVNGILNICNSLIYFLGGYLVFKNVISAGELLALAILFGRIWSPIEFFLGFKKNVSKAKVSEKRIFDILNIKMDNIKVGDLKSFSELSIEKINFSFEDKKIFDNACLYLSIDKLYYIKGGNGSGKTTLFDIISKILLTPINLNVDGNSILDSNSFLASNIFYVPSEIFWMDDFISDDIKKYVKKHGLIDENILNKNTSELSSGEKRILQICLAVNRKERILIFDEPLNYISDSKIELILELLNNLKKNRIILVSSHNKKIEKISDHILNIKNYTIDMQK